MQAYSTACLRNAYFSFQFEVIMVSVTFINASLILEMHSILQPTHKIILDLHP